MHELGTIQNYTGSGEIERRRIVAFDATEGQVKQATATSDTIIGVTGIHPCEGAGLRVDVQLAGLADVEFGAAVAQGDRLTVDAQGRAVPAAPAAGTRVQIVGTALVVGEAGSYGQILVNPATLTGV